MPPPLAIPAFVDAVLGAFWNYRHSERGNPKSETRSPKQTPSTKEGMTQITTLLAVLGLGLLGI
jgi:hypothetical protein